MLFHQQTLDLFGRVAEFSDARRGVLAERERMSGVRFPASVAEWYSLDGPADMLAAYSAQDHPLPLEQLGELVSGPFAGRADCGEPFPAAPPQVLVVLIENQAVYYWGVAIDRTLRADPPVYVLDRSPREVEQRWQPYTRSFSALVFTQVWTWQPHTGPWLQVFGALRQEQVVRYQTMFMMLPTTYGGSAPVTYRFDRGVAEQRVAIWHDAGRAEQDCWWLWAPLGCGDAVIGTGPVARWRLSRMRDLGHD